MKNRFQIILLLAVLLASGEAINAKEYRGITPLHSTRDDVTRILGKSPDENDIRANYDSENERIYIVFSGGLSSDCATRLPHDTVMLIQVTPKKETRLSDLQVDKKELRKFDPSSGMGFDAFIDEKQGIVIRAFKNKVDEIDYIAAEKDKSLCPSYYENPESFVRIVVDFFPIDEFGKSSFNDLTARLDNFYYQLKGNSESVGFIVNEGTDKETAKRRAAITKAFKLRKYDLIRIKFVRRRSAEKIRTELWILPANIGSRFFAP